MSTSPLLESQAQFTKAPEGLRVLDFTQTLAGPFCMQMLAVAGATVITVGPPARVLENPWCQAWWLRAFGS